MKGEMGDKPKLPEKRLPEKRLPEGRAATFVASSPAKGKPSARHHKPATPAKPSTTEDMSDIRTEARSFCESLSNVFLLKKRDPQSKHLLEKAQSLINGLLAEMARPATSAPTARSSRAGAGMGQLWVKLDELKRENDDLRRQRGRSNEERAGSPKSPKSPKPQPGQIETPLADFNKMKQENESLSQQVEKLQKNIKEHQVIAANLQDECKRYKTALEAAQKLAMKAREDLKKSEMSLSSVKAENETMKNKQASQPSNPPTPPSKSKPSVSSPKPSKTRTDNRHTENISERCRPSSIAVAYTTLESQQWMDAKEALEEGDAEEEEIVKFLCDVIMTSYKVNSTVLQSVEKIIAQVISCPTIAVQLAASMPSSTCKLSEEMSDLVCQRLRASFDKIDTTALAKLIRENYNQNTKLVSRWSEEALQRYVKECGTATWQMAIQKPPMKLVDKHGSYDDMKHRLWWSCSQAKARKVDYTIWPALYDYEGGILMVKACVYAS